MPKNKGGVGFLFWNADNDYSKPYAAMPEMKAAKGKYFRGDEMPGVAGGPATTASVPAGGVSSLERIHGSMVSPGFASVPGR